MICGLSGGVDSAVAAVLIHGRSATSSPVCSSITGSYVKAKRRSGQSVSRPFNIPLVHVDASEEFIQALAGVKDPETKRKTIGKLFIDTFEAEARRIASDGKGPVEFLAQGTLYPDVIESVSFSGGPSVTIRATIMSAACPSRCT